MSTITIRKFSRRRASSSLTRARFDSERTSIAIPGAMLKLNSVAAGTAVVVRASGSLLALPSPAFRLLPAAWDFQFSRSRQDKEPAIFRAELLRQVALGATHGVRVFENSATSGLKRQFRRRRGHAYFCEKFSRCSTEEKMIEFSSDEGHC